MDENCIVCAEPLEWAGYGPCGHHSACSKCMARLRFVLDDKRCAICRQPCDVIFITRHLGKYTIILRSDQLLELKDSNRKNNYFYLESINAYFDTEEQYNKIKELCSHTHPILNEENRETPNFKNINTLKNYIQYNYQKYFCDICLTGRKVFACEQILYTKKELVEHNSIGDKTGILAQSGFKGHPKCGFCNLRFYGDTELYNHNQTTHETCFICKRDNPQKFLYYRNYIELEEHFMEVHHPCPHPICIEKKFIVFNSESELKSHTLKEHPDMYDGLSKSQMKETLKIETNFHFKRPVRNHHHHHRYNNNNNDGNDENDVEILNDTEIQTRQLTNAEIAMSLTDADFPSISGNEGALSLNSNNRQISKQWINSKKKAQVRQLDFPKLSSNSSNQSSNGIGVHISKFNNKKNKTNQNKHSVIDPNLREFPSLSQNKSNRTKQQWNSSSTVTKSVSNQIKQPIKVINREHHQEKEIVVNNKSKPKISISDESAFPSLSNNNSYSKTSVNRQQQWGQQRAPSMSQASSSQSNIMSKESMATSTVVAAVNKKVKLKNPILDLDTGPLPSEQRQQQQQRCRWPQIETSDFPSLPKSFESEKNSQSNNLSNNSYKNIMTYTKPSISKKMNELNKKLLELFRQQLDEMTFKEFHSLSNNFLRGGYSAEVYHKRLIEYGLSHLISELTSLCPDEHKRLELLIEHRKFIEKHKQNPTNTLPSFVTLEILENSFENSLKKTAWICSNCQLVNAPSDDFCEKCDTLRKMNDMQLKLQKLSLRHNVNMIDDDTMRMTLVTGDNSSRSEYRRM